MSRFEYYYRECGVVCYSLPLFSASQRPYRRVPDGFQEAVLASNLEWCWRSHVRTPNTPDTHAMMEQRSLTTLSAETRNKFVADIEYIDEWDNGKGIELFAYDPGMPLLMADDDDCSLRAALAQLAAYERGPLKLVIVTLDDEDNSFVFVPHDPIPFIAELLEGWGAPKARENRWRKYVDLRIVKLETIYAIPSVHD